MELATTDIPGETWQDLTRQKRVYVMPDFCQISLPLQNPGPDAAEWVRSNGSRIYTLHPQTTIDNRGKVTHVWPYGKIGRLLLLYICTEVVRQKNTTSDRIIMLPSSLRQLMDAIGMHFNKQPSKRYYQQFRSQLVALSNFHMTIQETQARGETDWYTTSTFTLAEKAEIGWHKVDHSGRAAEGSYIQLTQETWTRMTKSVPLLSDMVEILTTGHTKGQLLDIYMWLSQRVYSLNHSRSFVTPLITWQSLQAQMGASYAETRNFAAEFKKSFIHVADLWQSFLEDQGKGGHFRYSIERGGIRLIRSQLSVTPRKHPRIDHKPATEGTDSRNKVQPESRNDGIHSFTNENQEAAADPDLSPTAPDWRNFDRYGQPLR